MHENQRKEMPMRFSSILEGTHTLMQQGIHENHRKENLLANEGFLQY